MRFWRHHLLLLTRTALLLTLVAVCWPTWSRVAQWWDPVQAAQRMEVCTSAVTQAAGESADPASPQSMQGAEHCLSGCCLLSWGPVGSAFIDASKPVFAQASTDTRPDATLPMAYWVIGLWPPTVPQPPPLAT